MKKINAVYSELLLDLILLSDENLRHYKSKKIDVATQLDLVLLLLLSQINIGLSVSDISQTLRLKNEILLRMLNKLKRSNLIIDLFPHLPGDKKHYSIGDGGRLELMSILNWIDKTDLEHRQVLKSLRIKKL